MGYSRSLGPLGIRREQTDGEEEFSSVVSQSATRTNDLGFKASRLQGHAIVEDKQGPNPKNVLTRVFGNDPVAQ